MNSPKLWCCAALLVASQLAFAQAKISDNVVRIGVNTDLSGFLSDVTGEGAVYAVRMAVADFGGKVLDKPIEVLAADNLNKADLAANQARSWFDTQQVDMIIDLGNSATALSAAQIAAQKNRIAIATSPGTTRLTNENCAPGTIHYAYDTYALANGIVKTLVKDGQDSWYFLTIDFAGGHSIEKDAADMVKAGGGKVLGAARHPIDTSDFSAYILPRLPSPRSSASPPLASPPSTPSRPAASSAWANRKYWRACTCSSATCTAWACRRHRTCT
jgi:branched-chain amino acid transport system substrate-binding protein